MIHRIEANKDFIIYASDKGVEELENSLKEALTEEADRLNEILRRKKLLKKIEDDRQKRRELMASFIKSLKK